MSERPTILLVENDRADAELTRQALRRHRPDVELVIDHTGDAALERLAHSPRPADLVLLDLNMPGTDGRTVLAEIRRRPRLRSLPVVILTTSSNPTDVDACYAAGANAYVTKPMGFGDRVTTLNTLCDFWLQAARLPEG